MSNPGKKWSWGMAFGRAVGGAVGPGAAAFVVGTLCTIGAGPLMAFIGAAGGFTSGFLGAALGYWWGDPFDGPEPLSSAALYTMVVGGILASLLYFLAFDQLVAERNSVPQVYFWIGTLSAFFGSASRSLLDDLRASGERRRERSSLS